MARQTLTKVSALGTFPTLPLTANSVDLTFVAADATNKEQFVSSGKDLVLAYNSGVSTRTVTFTSVAHPKTGRTGDITTYSMQAGEYAVFGPFEREGWQQADGNIYMEASHADVKWIVIALPQ